MSVNSKVVNGIVHVSLTGDLLGENTGIELVDLINEKLNSDKLYKYILDMSEARYINSQGLGVLITSYTKVKNNDGSFVLLNPSEPIKKLLSITKLDSVFQVYNSISEAEAALNS
jgi:anti-sigma B factor antagonist